MIRWKKAAAAAAIAVTTALAVTACSAGSSDSGGGSGSGGTLTITAIAAPATFDPAEAQWGNLAPFYQAVYDTLLLATTEGHDRALAGDEVVVQHRQHGAHAHPS